MTNETSHKIVEVNSIDDLTVCGGAIEMTPNTTYIIGNIIEMKCRTTLKRKVKRFNSKRYQLVAKAPIKGLSSY